MGAPWDIGQRLPGAREAGHREKSGKVFDGLGLRYIKWVASAQAILAPATQVGRFGLGILPTQ